MSLLTGTVATTRFLFRSHYLYDLDSVNFALAVGHFDPRVDQPHPPGYFLYICLGRLLNTQFHDVNLALVVLSILASCGTVILIYLIALDWFGVRAARFAGGLFVFSPLAWFHGSVALTYSVEAFFSSLVGYLCWRLYCGNHDYLVVASLALGVSAGFRPSSLLFLGPLFLFSLRHEPKKRRWVGVATLVLTLAAWFVPMIVASGGFSAYFGALYSLWRMEAATNTVFNSSPATSIARAFTVIFIYCLGFGAASIAPLGAKYQRGTTAPGMRMFTAVWVVPALCFFVLIFLQFVNSGYLLLLAAPSCLWLGYWASGWYANAAWRHSLKLATIAGCATVNVLIFLVSPLYSSYRSVRKFEAALKAIQTALPQVASTDNTLIIGFDSHFLGYRHAGYYLPGYLTVEYPEVKLSEGARVFVMEKRDTTLIAVLPAASYSRFLLFPLPEGEPRYRAYLQAILLKLPPQDLRTVRVQGFEFVTGPIADLSLLFPEAASCPAECISAASLPAPPVNSRAHQPR